MPVVIQAGSFERPDDGERFGSYGDLPLSGEPAWQSSAHSRALYVHIPELSGSLVRLHLVGAFNLADEASGRDEPALALQLLANGEASFSKCLYAFRHLQDSRTEVAALSMSGDGISRETLGEATLDGSADRVDSISVDLSLKAMPERLRINVLHEAVRVRLFDVLFEFEGPSGCPFRGSDGRISLSEIGAIVRLRDRQRLRAAIRQLRTSIFAAGSDLDEARSLALTFLAVVSSALLELGGSRDIHYVQLRAARKFESLRTATEIADAACSLAVELAGHSMTPPPSASELIIDRALGLLERHYARPLTDRALARRLGLSPSHFRHLFRKATGKPFHQYLMALRLEQARRRLLEEPSSAISEIAASVGFASPAHFSRAFNHRFKLTPSALRRAHPSGPSLR